MVRLSVMTSSVAIAVLCAVSLSADDKRGATDASPIAVAESDWAWWRGPSHNGNVPADKAVPLSWSNTENIIWRTPVPGRSHGSPIVVGDQVILQAAELNPLRQSVICFDRNSGQQLWKTLIHDGGTYPPKSNGKASMASSTPACDGERVYVNFLHDGAVYTTALDRSGNEVWQKKISDYIVHQGYGSSPYLYESLVLVTADNKGGGAVAALDRRDGTVVWRHDRPKQPNYASPIVLHAHDHDQLILTGCDMVVSYNPLSGEKLWEVKGATTECVTSTVTDGDVVFSSGGYPKNHVAAYHADGSGTIAWENTTRVYVPSMLLTDGYLYGIADAGIANCWNAATGEEMWQGRINGTFTASPVLVGEHIYATNEAGRTYVFRASPEEFELLSENQLGDDVMASPAVSRGSIFMRIARGQGDTRQEELVRIGTR